MCLDDNSILNDIIRSGQTYSKPKNSVMPNISKSKERVARISVSIRTQCRETRVGLGTEYTQRRTEKRVAISRGEQQKRTIIRFLRRHAHTRKFQRIISLFRYPNHTMSCTRSPPVYVITMQRPNEINVYGLALA